MAHGHAAALEQSQPQNTGKEPGSIEINLKSTD